ncbi:hypothetical protein JAAARDRAFT_191821 [Jaapia argillacea MUCL 33604]|uniref:Uncharacterized protein n=1 Tax=Jaapia argillacea MUCL 33604 TaxID=933084 RepID=A0A067QAD2_9AGAM|nr:hypothetical protein JAAARDRAFT_191821 [Jaapia argillacea MUCL 33604]
MPQPSPQITTFSSVHSAGIQVSLSRFKNAWFITFPRAYGMVAYNGQRIHSRLNVAEPGTRKNTFYFNTDWSIEGPVFHPFNVLSESEPVVVRPTGRKRMEKKAGSDEEVECVEFEVVIPEEGLLKQCYYCLYWEELGSPRFDRCGVNEDYYWCRQCQARGKPIAFLSSMFRRDTVLPSYGDWETGRKKDNLYR